MKKLITLFLAACLTTSIFSSGQTTKANGIELWYETFGEKKDPAFLLIMGGLCQEILWPTEFCEHLTKAGFYVIRYDHRDSGLSTCLDFEKHPYTLFDMAKDAVGLLDALQIDKAHLCGFSMGGPIAELISVHFPTRVATLTLIATSCDLRPSSLAYDEHYPADLTLSRPKEIYLNWMHNFLKNPPLSNEQALEGRVACWSILNGNVASFEEARYREIHQEFLFRLKHPESLTNHLAAIKNSFEMIQTAPHLVKVPTLIIHGTEDPILPPDHGEALHAAIAGSRYLLIEGLGHVLNRQFYDLIIHTMEQHARTTQTTP
jgi:pimeloyl-ACP methyl ester carboxylesterase